MCLGPPDLHFSVEIITKTGKYKKNGRTLSLFMNSYVEIKTSYIDGVRQLFEEFYRFLTMEIGDEDIEEMTLYFAMNNQYKKFLDNKIYDFSKLSTIQKLKIADTNFFVNFYPINNLKNLKHLTVNSVCTYSSGQHHIDFKILLEISLPLEVIIFNFIEYQYSTKSICGKILKTVSIKNIPNLPQTLKLLILNDNYNKEETNYKLLYKNFIKNIPNDTKLIIGNYTEKKLSDLETQIVNNSFDPEIYCF